MNLERNKRKHQDYKMLLVDKLQTKEGRACALKDRQNHLIDHGQRMNQTMQEQFYRTTATTKNAILPQPFENHKKEFDNMKEVKLVEKTEDWANLHAYTHLLLKDKTNKILLSQST